jgi:NADH-quinone oxidoreductase subunit N
MTKATDISILILMGTSLVVLALEAIGTKQFKTGLVEKPHIRLLTISALIIAGLLIFFDLMNVAQIARQPIVYIDEIASLFLVINAVITVLLGQKTLIKNQNGEIFFLILASLTLSIKNVCTDSLTLKLITGVGWLILLTTLTIKCTPGGKKAEIGLKLTFCVVIFFLQLLLAIFLLNYANISTDLNLLNLNSTTSIVYGYLAIILVTLSMLSLAGIPPFHFGHIDSADGGNISVAFLQISNASIQSGVTLLSLKTALTRSNLDVENSLNFISLTLVIGFMILWLRALDQSKIRRTIAYVGATIAPLFSMSILFGTSALLPKLIFLLAIFSFVTLTLFTLFGSLAYMDPIHMPWQTWEEMSGFGRTNPWQTLTFLVAISSIAGIPGTLGYFVKLSLIAPLHDSVIFSGSVFLSIAFGAACVMRVFVFMFSKQTQNPGATLRPPASLVMASLILIALGFFPFVR